MKPLRRRRRFVPRDATLRAEVEIPRAEENKSGPRRDGKADQPYDYTLTLRPLTGKEDVPNE
ncbi:hypothetical protein [Streptomyces sp. ME19-01-6]|uniref:hypothetical protein n=1 Tax=Streptomyces sp. ME19-01-6 TaxID=3028686 RepID=UPI0029A78EF4|nr:hypothetical protein [Streptomyces sp. ME19-01-6]MDX3232427.1 hypothetical protein [Streptomyces sp. ME19-01-6]